MRYLIAFCASILTVLSISGLNRLMVAQIRVWDGEAVVIPLWGKVLADASSIWTNFSLILAPMIVVFFLFVAFLTHIPRLLQSNTKIDRVR